MKPDWLKTSGSQNPDGLRDQPYPMAGEFAVAVLPRPRSPCDRLTIWEVMRLVALRRYPAGTGNLFRLGAMKGRDLAPVDGLSVDRGEVTPQVGGRF